MWFRMLQEKESSCLAVYHDVQEQNMLWPFFDSR